MMKEDLQIAGGGHNTKHQQNNALSLDLQIQIAETQFTDIQNKSGPRTEPCRTPLRTLVGLTLEKQNIKYFICNLVYK